MKNNSLLPLLLAMVISGLNPDICFSQSAPVNNNNLHSMLTTSKPFTRYWWFASMIKKEDVRYNLNWLKDNGFGGVELAWVFPLNRSNKQMDQSYTPRQEWLSPEWQEIVSYTISYADSIGLACDMTMGTLWPFGDSYVPYEQAAQKFGVKERQKITASWEYPKEGYVIDHLNSSNYMPYFNRLLDSFPHPRTRLSQSYFIDSWEVETEKMWAEGFRENFEERYKYDITPYMDSIYIPANKDYLYDYSKLVSEKVIRFYKNFDEVLGGMNIFSRGQCSGAPCDIISAYATLDIPEGEALLYEPEFNSIPASAAVLSGKKVVSSETFTCLYGWPRHYIREEQAADLKLLADALFACGINHIIWHGKPHNPAGQDTVNFYASVHVGSTGKLADEIPVFNQYLEKVSVTMKRGTPYTDIAVYLPVEDSWMKGIMPKEQQFKWAWGYYEMRYVYFPDELCGFHPTWINREFLEKAEYKDGFLRVGDARFSALYIDVMYLDYAALQCIFKLAQQGLPVIMKQEPAEAGALKHEKWPVMIHELKSLPNVTQAISPSMKPLVSGVDPYPLFRAREEGETIYLFFANPAAKGLKFPLDYGQSFTAEAMNSKFTVHYKGHVYPLNLVFKPFQSLLYKIGNGKAELMDIRFVPKTPEVKPRPADFKAPWLVE